MDSGDPDLLNPGCGIVGIFFYRHKFDANCSVISKQVEVETVSVAFADGQCKLMSNVYTDVCAL